MVTGEIYYVSHKPTTYLKESLLSDNFQWKHDHDQQDYDQEDTSEASCAIYPTKARVYIEKVLPPRKAVRPQWYKTYVEFKLNKINDTDKNTYWSWQCEPRYEQWQRTKLSIQQFCEIWLNCPEGIENRILLIAPRTVHDGTWRWWRM